MDFVFCRFVDKTGGLAIGSDEFCDRIAVAIDARLIDSADLGSVVAGKTSFEPASRLHKVEATALSAHAITMRYAVGTVEAWGQESERVYDEQRFDIMDASVNEALVSMVVETVVELAEDAEMNR